MRYSSADSTFHGSATDLADQARCSHLTQRNRQLAVDVAEGRAERIEPTGLAVEKGREFERMHVAAVRAEVEAAGGRFVDVTASAGRDQGRRFEVRDEAMRAGVELIAQAPLRAGALFGYADLLVRVDDGAGPGGSLTTVHRYEPVEVKFGRSPRPEYVLQACAYADALERLQGELPATLHIVCGDGRSHPFATREYVEYFRAARDRFGAALTLDLDTELDRVPDPVSHCATCAFAQLCCARRRAVDHIGVVARIRADQRIKLAAAGVRTLTELATTELERVPGIGRATFAQLRAQAGLQRAALATELPGIEYRVPVDGELAARGFALLPDPDDADMFFDFEGYPYHEHAGTGPDDFGLEYLWGWTTRNADGARRFDHLWAEDTSAEDAAFTQFLNEVHARRERAPGMHVFHYAPYEITALRRLARRNPLETDRLDALLRAGVFIDLYAVVRQAMLIGVESYSIKSLEPLYGVDRSHDELADGGASIEVFETWATTRDEVLRQTIIDYNRVDCDSTLDLRDWLLERREEARARGIEWPVPVFPDVDVDLDAEAGAPPDPRDEEILRGRLKAVADDASHANDVRLAARLLGAMPGWKWRIKREFLGDLHGRKHDRDTEDHINDAGSIGGLQLLEEGTPPGARAGTMVRRYSFPDQVTLLRAEDGTPKPHAYDPEIALQIGVIDSIDFDANELYVRTSAAAQARLDTKLAELGEAPGRVPISVVGWNDIPIQLLEGAAAQVAAHFLSALAAGRDPFAAGEPGAAALSVLTRHVPRVTHGSGPEQLGTPPDPAALAELVTRLDGSHVIVQGPPGTGKTYTSARLVIALVDQGMRVGISSNSHDAVINVLRGIDAYRAERAAAGSPVRATAIYAPKGKDLTPGALGFGADWLTLAKSGTAAGELVPAHDIDILAGTAWQFTKGVPLDAVLVDEAGQLSLLHGTAIASDARRLILVGDPQQLPQPSGTGHPHGCDASVLEHLFQGHAVLGRERAALLSVTRRMHPYVSDFISATYYEGELEPFPDTVTQMVDAPAVPGLPTAGTHLLTVDHTGNRSSAPEEVEAIHALVARLLDGGRVVPRPGVAMRAVRAEDIIVVAPYNAQRRLLQERLGPDIRVGTVDKFQGQEAPIAIVSLTASSREELPRGLEFLLDPHRMNVAISRARALAIVVASPSLLATDAANLCEMRLLNDLARFARWSALGSSRISRPGD